MAPLVKLIWKVFTAKFQSILSPGSHGSCVWLEVQMGEALSDVSIASTNRAVTGYAISSLLEKMNLTAL